MTKIIINHIPPEIEAWLARRARERGCSLEEEIQNILISVQQEEASNNLAQRIQDLFVPLGGVDLPEILRDPMPELPQLKNDHPRYQCDFRISEG